MQPHSTLDAASVNVFDPSFWPYPITTEQIVIRLSVEGEPVSKARARYTRAGRMYTPQKTVAHEAMLKLLMRAELGAIDPDGKSRFGLRSIFYRSTRQRIDCDNLLKAVSDAANGVVWKDDAQVVEVIGRLFLADASPRTEIVIYRVDDPAPRDKCPVCGKEVVTYPSQGVKYCSLDCYNKTLRTTLECRWCKKEYEVPISIAKRGKGFCSRQCSREYHGRKRSELNGPQTWKCIDCGGPVSRREYERCRACSMIHRQDPTSNYWKLRHAYHNDNQVAEIHACRHEDKNSPRVEVEILAK